MNKLFSIKDNISNTFSSPFLSTNDATAVRSFKHTVNDATTTIHHSPDDYVLYQVGLFDDSTGDINPVITVIAHASELVDT